VCSSDLEPVDDRCIPEAWNEAEEQGEQEGHQRTPFVLGTRSACRES
jgi:hypothetical protein